jgi:CubicO group peptidase (beta-lactamase class C family)
MTDRRTTLQGIAASIGALGLSGTAFAAAPGLPGSYVGTLVAGSKTLRLQLVIATDKIARLISLDQGNAIIPATEVRLTGNRIVIVFAGVNARYEAALVDANTLEGTFTQGASFPLRMTRGLPSTVRSSDPLEGQKLTAALLAAYRTKTGTPGMGAAWQSNSRPPQYLFDGTRRASDPAPVMLHDKWHFGSNTKAMTATLLARAVEAGMISWTTTVEETFALDMKEVDPVYRTASVLHLLSHHSGLPKDISLAELGQYSRDGLPNPLNERRRLALRALSLRPEAAPGSKMIYSNNGYVVAAAMLEKRVGKSWEDLIQRLVFGPLGLSSAGFGPPENPQINDQPSGHSIGQNGTRTASHLDNPVAMAPAGRVHMSLPDFLSWLSAHRDRSSAFLRAESWDMLHKPPFTGGYALGWFVGPKGSLWHNGSNGIWYTEGMIDREAGAVAAFVSNDSAASSGGPGKVLKAAMRAAMAK